MNLEEIRIQQRAVKRWEQYAEQNLNPQRTRSCLFHFWGPHEICPHGERVIPKEVLDIWFPEE